MLGIAFIDGKDDGIIDESLLGLNAGLYSISVGLNDGESLLTDEGKVVGMVLGIILDTSDGPLLSAPIGLVDGSLLGVELMTTVGNIDGMILG